VQDYARDVRTSHPEVLSMRWFGSWVRGDASVGSDVDMRIIVDRSERSPRDRIAEFLPLVFPVGIDLFVYTSEEYDLLRTAHPTMHTAMESGIEV
jgi:predicted nucleotidyltransferase